MTAYKTFEPELKAADAKGNATFAIATLGVVDHDGDVTEPGFFGRQPVQMLPSHDSSHVPLGKGVIYEQGDKAIADVKFNLAIPAARDWHAAIKFDFENPPSLQEYSYGFQLAADGQRTGTFKGRAVRFLQPRKDGSPGARVFEVSPVLLGAGIGTHTVAVKGRYDAETQRLLDAAKARVDAYEREQKTWLESVRRSVMHERAARRANEECKAVTGHKFDEVPASLVDRDKVCTARAASAHFAKRLNIATPPEVRWFVQGEFTLWGKAYRPLNAVWLNAGIKSDLEIWLVTAHEVGHIAGMNELEARGFEQAMRRELIERAA